MRSNRAISVSGSTNILGIMQTDIAESWPCYNLNSYQFCRLEVRTWKCVVFINVPMGWDKNTGNILYVSGLPMVSGRDPHHSTGHPQSVRTSAVPPYCQSTEVRPTVDTAGSVTPVLGKKQWDQNIIQIIPVFSEAGSFYLSEEIVRQSVKLFNLFNLDR